MTKQLVIWIDHKEARVFRLEADPLEEATVGTVLHNTHHRHAKGGTGDKEHPDDAKRFFHDVVGALQAAEEILVVGPSTAKLELIRYLHEREAILWAKVIGIETVDHPSDGQIKAYARKYFAHPPVGAKAPD